MAKTYNQLLDEVAQAKDKAAEASIKPQAQEYLKEESEGSSAGASSPKDEAEHVPSVDGNSKRGKDTYTGSALQKLILSRSSKGSSLKEELARRRGDGNSQISVLEQLAKRRNK